MSIVVGVPPEHCQPLTVPSQSAVHPSVPSVFPSSQVSPATLKPSPQIGNQTVAPLKLLNPVAQVVHDVAPAVFENVPAVHESQFVCPTLAIVPANH